MAAPLRPAVRIPVAHPSGIAAVATATVTAVAASAGASVATPAVASAAPVATAIAPRRSRVARADADELLGALARDIGVLGEAQADPAALAGDLDHADLELVALVEDLLDRR